MGCSTGVCKSVLFEMLCGLANTVGQGCPTVTEVFQGMEDNGVTLLELLAPSPRTDRELA